MTWASGIFVVAFLVVLPAVIVAGVWAMKAKKSTRAVIFLPIGGLLVFGFGLGFVGRAGVSSQSTSPVTMLPAVSPVAGDDSWFAKLDDTEVTRDVYTDPEHLTASMAARIDTACEKVGSGSPRRFMSDNVEPELSKPIFDALVGAKEQDAFDGASRRPDDETWVKLSLKGQSTYRLDGWSTPFKRGMLIARVTGPKGATIVDAKFDEKPWLQPGAELPGAGYRVITSGPQATSYSDAVSQLQSRITGEMTTAIFDQARVSTASPPTYSAVRTQVGVEVMQARFEIDRCVVGIDRPYGRIWYAAALVNASPDTLTRVATQAIAVQSSRTQSSKRLALALGGMMLTLAFVYLGLNAITRGYLRGPLIFGTITVAGVLMMAIWLFLN